MTSRFNRLPLLASHTSSLRTSRRERARGRRRRLGMWGEQPVRWLRQRGAGVVEAAAAAVCGDADGGGLLGGGIGGGIGGGSGDR